MSKQRRMLCKECNREWVPKEKSFYSNSAPASITGNKRADLCPFCGSESPELVEFESPLAGLDIPRDNNHIYPNQNPIEERIRNEPEQRAPGFISNRLIENLIREQEKEN